MVYLTSDGAPCLGLVWVGQGPTDEEGLSRKALLTMFFAAHAPPSMQTKTPVLKAIETIEFVLGMVSNTASYLRLWALSLAHTELAAVFWEKTMLTTIQMGNAFAIFIGFAMFAGVTFGVILCMDVLECFLHALRLHWVEFQTKFYKADG